MTAPRRWKVHSLSLPGDAHLRKEIPCQDFSSAHVSPTADWAWAIVADGHGSERYFRSARGSRFAVEVLENAFESVERIYHAESGEGTAPSSRWDDWAASRVVTWWRDRVYRDLVTDPPSLAQNDGLLNRYLDSLHAKSGWAAVDRFLSQLRAFEQYVAEAQSRLDDPDALILPSDPGWDADLLGDWHVTAYGSTLLGVIAGPDAIHWFQLGDGAMVKIVGGEAIYLEPPPKEAIANETPSLSADGAVRAVNVGTIHLAAGGIPSAVMLTTDGIPNSYETPSGFFSFCSDVAAQAYDRQTVPEKLERWLAEISRRGSGDDVSLAMIYSSEQAETELLSPSDVHTAPRAESADETPTGDRGAGDGSPDAEPESAAGPTPSAAGPEPPPKPGMASSALTPDVPPGDRQSREELGADRHGIINWIRSRWSSPDLTDEASEERESHAEER